MHPLAFVRHHPALPNSHEPYPSGLRPETGESAGCKGKKEPARKSKEWWESEQRAHDIAGPNPLAEVLRRLISSH